MPWGVKSPLGWVNLHPPASRAGRQAEILLVIYRNYILSYACRRSTGNSFGPYYFSNHISPTTDRSQDNMPMLFRLFLRNDRRQHFQVLHHSAISCLSLCFLLLFLGFYSLSLHLFIRCNLKSGYNFLKKISKYFFTIIAVLREEKFHVYSQFIIVNQDPVFNRFQENAIIFVFI